MNKLKTYVSKRQWLNPKSSCDTGAVQYNVNASDKYVDATLSIWDCSKKITLSLDFDATDTTEVAQRVRKVDLLIASLQDMREGMERAYIDRFNKQGDDEAT